MYSQDGTRRDDGAKKTLTDFRIIGVDCPTLKWSWGIIPHFVAKDVTDGNGAPEEPAAGPSEAGSTLESEEAPETPKLPSFQISDSETVMSSPATIGPSQPTSIASSTETLLATPQKTQQLPQMPSPNACAISRAPTETSRIRLYFNSPVELEDRPALHGTPMVDQTNQHQQRRGGKRKKEHEEGEPEEGSKRKKEDNDLNGHHTHAPPPNESVTKAIDRTPNGSTHPRNEATLEPSGIGAKRKAHSLSGDEEDGDRKPEHDHDHRPTLQSEQPRTNEAPRLEADHDAETEYAGSPPHDVFLDYPDPPHSVFSTAEGEVGGEGDDDEIIPASQAPTEVADPDPHEQPYYVSENDGPDAPYEDNISAASEIEGNMPTDADARSHNDEGTAQRGDDSPQIADRTCDVNQDNRNTTDAGALFPTSPPASTGTHVTKQPINPVPAAPAVTAPADRTPSPNRISISYAGSSRRLVLDAEIIQLVKIFRAEGRIEVRFVLEHVKSPSPSLPASAPGLVPSAMPNPVASSTDQDSGSEQAAHPTPVGASGTANDICVGEGRAENISGNTSVVADGNVAQLTSDSSTDTNVGHTNEVVESSSARLASPPAPQPELQSAASPLQSHVGMVQCRGILASHLSLSSSPEGAIRRWCAHHSDILRVLFISFSVHRAVAVVSFHCMVFIIGACRAHTTGAIWLRVFCTLLTLGRSIIRDHERLRASGVHRRRCGVTKLHLATSPVDSTSDGRSNRIS